MMGRAFVIPEEAKLRIWQSLQNRDMVPKPYGTFSSPRLATKQFKFQLSIVFQSIFTEILKKTSALLLQSKKEPWPQAFATVLALSMVVESLQMMILCKERLNSPVLSKHSFKNTNEDILNIDKQLHFLIHLLQTKYNSRRAHNWRPLSDRLSCSELGGAADRELIESLTTVVGKHGKCL